MSEKVRRNWQKNAQVPLGYVTLSHLTLSHHIIITMSKLPEYPRFNTQTQVPENETKSSTESDDKVIPAT
jgi:hypothetical protein